MGGNKRKTRHNTSKAVLNIYCLFAMFLCAFVCCWCLLCSSMNCFACFGLRIVVVVVLAFVMFVVACLLSFKLKPGRSGKLAQNRFEATLGGQ